MSSRTLITLFLSVLIGVGVAFIHSFNVPEALPPQAKSTAPSYPVNVAPAPKILTAKAKERIKNKRFTQVRISREIGTPPTVRLYLDSYRNLSNKDFHCLALNIYHEARGEHIIGMMAIAQVTLNRLDAQWRGKKTLCQVVYDPNQFSWTRSAKKRNQKPTGASWRMAIQAAQKAVQGWRIARLEHALHYHADWIPHPKWSLRMELNHVIGQHVYLKDLAG